LIKLCLLLIIVGHWTLFVVTLITVHSSLEKVLIALQVCKEILWTDDIWRRIKAKILHSLKAGVSGAETKSSGRDAHRIMLVTALRADGVLVRVLRMRAEGLSGAPFVRRHAERGIVPVVFQRQDLGGRVYL